MEPAEKPDQQNDRDRDPDQPEQKTFTHYVLLVRLAHINVRWELRFHGKTAAESGHKQGRRCARGSRARARPGASGRDRIRGGRFVIYCITRIGWERRSRNVRYLPGPVRAAGMVASRAGAIRPAASAREPPRHHTCHLIFGAAHPDSFAAVYVIGIPTDGPFDCLVPNGPARAGVAGRP